jgi:alkylated DNA repair dioxygenase AlkB
MESLNLFSGLEEEVGLLPVAQAESVDEILSKVPGLSYRPDFISKDEELTLLQSVDKETWLTQWQRRIQYYGKRYAEGPLHGDEKYPVKLLPEWSKEIRERLVEQGVFKRPPSQIGVNEYLPGQGIAPHVDYSGGMVVSLSLLSGCLMDFTPVDGSQHVSLWLEPRSIVVLENEARYQWRHGISRRQKDIVQGRTIFRCRRVSVTFRDIIPRS